MRRESIIALAAKLPDCTVAMEACCGAHHLGRQLVAQGHEVRLMSPETAPGAWTFKLRKQAAADFHPLKSGDIGDLVVLLSFQAS